MYLKIDWFSKSKCLIRSAVLWQDIGTLVILFCMFQACVGFILPSLARLRTKWVTGARILKFKLLSTTFCLQSWHHCRYLPNELRGGMMSFSLSLANAAIFVFLLQVKPPIWSTVSSCQLSLNMLCPYVHAVLTVVHFFFERKNSGSFFFPPQGAHPRNISNSTILGLASYGLLGAGGCIHMLRRWRKHTRQNARSL